MPGHQGGLFREASPMPRTYGVDARRRAPLVAFMLDALRASGVVDAVESRISAHVHAAVAALDGEGLDPHGVAGLTQKAHRIAWHDR